MNSRRKYRNTPVNTPDGRFDSKAEYRRFKALRLLEMAGEISELKKQVRFDLHTWAGSERVKLASYIADFTYIENGALVVEDVKGPPANDTPLFKLKQKWMLAEHGIELKIVRNA